MYEKVGFKYCKTLDNMARILRLSKLCIEIGKTSSGKKLWTIKNLKDQNNDDNNHNVMNNIQGKFLYKKIY